MEGNLGLKAFRGPESWAFLAFVFTAFVDLMLSLVSEIPIGAGPRAGFKVVLFILLGYVILWKPWVRNKLVGLLGILREEKH